MSFEIPDHERKRKSLFCFACIPNLEKWVHNYWHCICNEEINSIRTNNEAIKVGDCKVNFIRLFYQWMNLS